MKDEVFIAALAGLLHDIGKFAQRAAEGVSRTWDSEAEQEYKYKHALHSGDFVERYVSKRWAGMLSGPAYHHRPQRHQDQVVGVADRLSAGERSDTTEHQPKQLRPIFSSLLLDKNDGSAGPKMESYLPLKALSVTKDVIFPGQEGDDSHIAYKKLWDDFTNEVERLGNAHSDDDKGNLFSYLSGLLDLMQRFTWCIPSAYYRAVPDVSLYDHSRMTGALAACLIHKDSAKVEDLFDGKNQQEPVALLIGGDISGVQKFIYTLTSSGAAKSLRGRSFYLQMLTEAVARYVLNELELPPTNLIYAGGGNFFILAATEHEAELDKIRSDVSERLLAAHDGAMGLVMGHTLVQAEEFKRTKFYEAWDRMYRHLNRLKLQPLIEFSNQRLGNEIGQGMGVGGDTDQMCNVCGKEAAGGEKFHREESAGEEIRICGVCSSLAELGNQLAKATHLITLFSEPRTHEHVDKWWKGLEAFGVNVWPINARDAPKGDAYIHFPPGLRLVEVNALADKETKHSPELESELKNSGAPVIRTFRPFAQLVPTDSRGLPLTFDELAKQATGGLKRWGVLRMDVDNLGDLFAEGFAQSKNGALENSLTISRLASLSFSLRLFFEGWVPKLGQEDENLSNRLYVQYAGGDDLFVVGSWDALPDFAYLIRNSFREYVCHHPRITLSGGMSLAAEKYPLYQAAGEAGGAEHAAKEFIRPPGSRTDGGPLKKDAFCFMGQVVGWEDFGPVQERAHQLKRWCNEDKVTRALLQILLSIHSEYQRGRNEALKNKLWEPGQVYFGPWMWHLAYQLARRIKDEHTPVDVAKELEQLEKEMLGGQSKIETIGLAARWAQYLVRE